MKLVPELVGGNLALRKTPFILKLGRIEAVPVEHMSGFVLLLDGVLDPKRREADPRRVDADLRRRERRVRRASTGRSENFLAAFFLTESACDRMGPTYSKKKGL